MTDTQTKSLASPTESFDPFADWDRWFDSFLAPFGTAWGVALSAPRSGGADGIRFARTDVTDTGASYRVTAELPGIAKEQVEVRIRGSSVEIEARSSQASESKDPKYLHRERSQSTFYRALEFPEPVVGAEAKASLSDGVLALEIPKLHPEPVPTEVKVPVQ